MLIATATSPWNGFLTGAVLGVITLVLLWVANRRLGISTGLEDVCALVSRRPYFQREEVSGSGRWRLVFFVGLVLGGVLSKATSPGGYDTYWTLGMFDQVIGWGVAAKCAWMVGGGLLIGFGTRLAGGCTSGHGIFGNANLEIASLVSTLSFMVAGIVTTNVIYRLVAGGGS
ncbi:MAG: YeeE/YedE family protein [Deltaproteobacteria bacterium]|nr:YeeE/YedE family protein [Deltaproteobacteria bacterium]